MMKRLLSVFIAVVIFTTAVVVLPQKNNIAQGAGTNTTWDNSVHALEDGDYPSHEMFTLTADEDEFSMPYKWHVTDFNHCDQDTIPGDNRPLYRERSETDFKIAVSIENAPAAIKNLTVSKHTQTAQAIRAEVVNSGNSNICTQVLNYNGAKLSDYQYLRFTVYLENVQLDPDPALQNSNDTKPYFLVQLYDDITKGSPFDRILTATLNEKCKDGVAYDFVYDLTAAADKIETLHAVEFHFRTIQKIDESKAGYVWYDNIRLVKNTTHTPYYASKVNVSQKVFNACDTGKSSFSYVANSNETIQPKGAELVADTNSGIDQSAGSLRIIPNANQAAWYQYSFKPDTSENFILDQYTYFRFYIHFRSEIPSGSVANTVAIESGKNWPNDYDASGNYPVTIWFSHYDDYSANLNKPAGYGFIRENIRLNKIKSGSNGKGWYVCMVPISAISSQTGTKFDTAKAIKSVSIQLGKLKFSGDSGNHCVNIDQLEFLSYTYTDDTSYAYRAGHYQILDGFEDVAEAKLNVRSDAGATEKTYLAMRHDDVATSLYYKNNFGGWLHEYSGANNSHYENYYAAEYDDIVTQGLYADWIRANEGTYRGIHSGNLEAAYNIRSESGGYFDLSKFTNFSLDLTIRPQHQTLADKSAPGLQGTEETFRIRVRTKADHNCTSYMTFKLNLSSDYTGEGNVSFYSSSDGIEILPLDGFMPGRDGAYTCSGSMRITFTLADLLKNADIGFDITQVEQIRFEWLKSGVGESGGTERSQDKYDNRYADFFLDNFVGFTPDMRITVKTEGVPESDATQSFVFNIKGGDEVSQHVDCNFTLQGNDIEEIYNLPFNSYTIQQTDWAWRYISDNPLDMQQGVAQQMATVSSPTGKFTYKDIVENNVSLHHTIVFRPKKTGNKWLSDERRVHFKAKN